MTARVFRRHPGAMLLPPWERRRIERDARRLRRAWLVIFVSLCVIWASIIWLAII